MEIETLNKLRELAEKATPGPWEMVSLSGRGNPFSIRMAYASTNPTAPKTYYGVQSVHRREDACLIAAANPSVILSLLSRIDELERLADGEVSPTAWRWAWKTTGSPLERRFADPDLYMWTYSDTPPRNTEKKDVEPLYTAPPALSELTSERDALRARVETLEGERANHVPDYREADRLKTALRKEFCVLFLDGRNEHGSHVLSSYPRSFDVNDDDLNEQAEGILQAAEAEGFVVGEDHVWAEFRWVDPQIGEESRVGLDGYWDFDCINVEMTRATISPQGEQS